jgi:hypothetical protein
MSGGYAVLENKQVRRVTSIYEWGKFMEVRSNRTVAKTTIGDVKISTVFLGIDHGYGGNPLWFETMVFGGPLDEEMERYETWGEAAVGHEKMVARVRAGK